MTARRVALVLATVCLGGLGVAACSDGGPGEGEARLEVDGVAMVRHPDGGDERVTGGETLHTGDRVEVTEGSATLALPGGANLELRAGTGDADNTIVTVGDRPSLEAGDLLAVADDRVVVEAADTVVSFTDGAGRISRYLGLAVGVYEGSAMVDSAGVERDVRALRRLAIPDLGRPERELTPIEYDTRDPWDRRFLSDAMALGAELDRLADIYTGSLSAGEGRTVGFYRIVLPGLDDEADLTQGLVDRYEVDPGSRLVGAAIAELGVRGTFAQRWDQVFSFRQQGAEWGLVALDQRVSRGPLIGAVEGALDATTFEFTAPPVTSGTTTPTTPGTSPPSTSPPGTAPGTTAPTTPPTSPPTTAPGSLDPVIEVVDPVEEVVNELLDDLLAPARRLLT